MYTSNRTLDTKKIEQTDTKIPVYRAAAVAEALDIYEERQNTFDTLLSQRFTQPVEEISEGLISEEQESTASSSTTTIEAEAIEETQVEINPEEEEPQAQPSADLSDEGDITPTLGQ